MNRIASFIFAVTITVVLLGGEALAQSTRSHVNKGVDLYNARKYAESETQFKKGLDKSPKNFQANFNLGDSYYKLEQYPDAMKYFHEALSKAKNPDLKSKVYHNIGNALLKDKKIKESIAAYTDALKLNPADMSTKYNLSYALDMLKHQKNKNKNDKNKNNKNNQKKKNQNKQNKNNNKNNQNKNKQNQNKNQQNNQQQNEQEKLSKQQAQAIFAALNHDEQKLQDKLRKHKGKPIKITKDW